MTLFKRICDCFQWVMSVKLSSSRSKSTSIQLRVFPQQQSPRGKGRKVNAKSSTSSQAVPTVVSELCLMSNDNCCMLIDHYLTKAKATKANAS